MKKGDYQAELERFDPGKAARRLKRRRSKLAPHHVHGPVRSVRESVHKKRKVKIVTTYEITIDGEKLGGHLAVGHDGRVHFHGLPNYSWGSAVEMCHELIDQFPADFPGPRKKSRRARLEAARKGTGKRKTARAKGSGHRHGAGSKKKKKE
ncbi:MAG: hypothetical protein R3325_11780 [Thermoanaerobaculia bacterium]|nr:hypothetical protein [Thermoanaerobaculia bacterium]